MIDHDEPAGSVVPLVRRWHVIQEIDLARLIADHAALREMCDRLEACADALPDRLRVAETAAICGSLREVVVGHAREESAVIERLFSRDLDDPLTVALVERIRARHRSDAVDVEDILTALAGEATPCAEAFGYMLRGFFDGCRRAMDFTELAILTLGGKRLTRDARTALVGGLCERGAG